MPDEASPRDSKLPSDVYTHGHTDSVLRPHRWRTLENSAAYLAPYLRADSHVLDGGCGPGTITVGLARVATQGKVTGIDRSGDVLAEAEAASMDAGVTNIGFVVGDAYALGFADHSFDVVHAHQVLQHLSDPVAALREVGRVCRSDGVVGVRDSDYGAFTWWPQIPELDEWLGVYSTVARSNGAEPNAGRRLKSWAQMSGLHIVSSTAGVWCYASETDVHWWGELWAERVTGSAMADQAMSRGIATAGDLVRLSDGWRHWSEAPDAWFALVHGDVVCTRSPALSPPDGN